MYLFIFFGKVQQTFKTCKGIGKENKRIGC